MWWLIAELARFSLYRFISGVFVRHSVSSVLFPETDIGRLSFVRAGLCDCASRMWRAGHGDHTIPQQWSDSLNSPYYFALSGRREITRNGETIQVLHHL